MRNFGGYPAEDLEALFGHLAHRFWWVLGSFLGSQFNQYPYNPYYPNYRPYYPPGPNFRPVRAIVDHGKHIN